MKVAALFVCANDPLYDAVNSNRERLIPEALRKRWDGISFSVIPLQLPLGASETECVNAIENAADGFDGVALLAPPQFSNRLNRVRMALFVVDYVPPEPLRNLQNQTARLLHRTLSDFGLLLSRASEMKYKRSLLLPLNDFSAPAMDSMRALFADLANEQQFSRSLDGVLREFRKLQVPLRVAKDEVHPVYVDIDRKRFDRGRETHAEAENIIPPHDALCGLNKAFRFGFSYPERLHFNVVVDGDVRSHRFAGCHEPHGEAQVKRATHANVFPNGYVS